MGIYKIADLFLKIEDGITLHRELEAFRLTVMDEGDEGTHNNQPVNAADFGESEPIEICFDRMDECCFKKEIECAGNKIIDFQLLNIYENDDAFLVSYCQPKLVWGYRVNKADYKALIFLTEEIDCYSQDELYNTTVEKREMEEASVSGPELLLYSIRDAFFYQAQKLGRIAVHSASVCYRDKVWLFSAPSGVGKSTHVDLWLKAGIDCQIFNGDVAMCYEKDGKVMAGGLPWCGTSAAYTNADMELGGVLFLKRADVDRIDELAKADGALSLNARCVTPNWTRTLVDRNISTCEKIVPKIITARLNCTPKEAAALLAANYFDEQL